jgi:hypothetical protein
MIMVAVPAFFELGEFRLIKRYVRVVVSWLGLDLMKNPAGVWNGFDGSVGGCSEL